MHSEVIRDVATGDKITIDEYGHKLVVVGVNTVETTAAVEAFKLANTRGKHIQITLKIEYEEDLVRKLGEMYGCEIGAVFQHIEYEEEAMPDGPELIPGDDDA